MPLLKKIKYIHKMNEFKSILKSIINYFKEI